MRSYLAFRTHHGLPANPKIPDAAIGYNQMVFLDLDPWTLVEYAHDKQWVFNSHVKFEGPVGDLARLESIISVAQSERKIAARDAHTYNQWIADQCGKAIVGKGLSEDYQQTFNDITHDLKSRGYLIENYYPGN